MTKEMTRRLERFPTILSSSFFDDFFEDYDKMFDKFLGTSQIVPCDVIQNKDEGGNIIDTELRYALAGYDKDNIAIEIDDNVLTCKVEKTEKSEDTSKKNYLHKGISHRYIEFSYRLDGFDKENITSSFENGILTIKLPISERKAIKKIKVNGSLPSKEANKQLNCGEKDISK